MARATGMFLGYICSDVEQVDLCFALLLLLLLLLLLITCTSTSGSYV